MVWKLNIETKNRTTGATVARRLIHFKNTRVILKQIKVQIYGK